MEEKENNIYQIVAFENIVEIIDKNNGYVTTKMVNDAGIHRMYLTKMKNMGFIENVEKGIYTYNTVIPDSYYILSISTPRIIFSHMTALYFHGLSIKAPDESLDITVPKKYNNSKLKNYDVFYVNDEVYELGLTKVKTPMGNTVRCYDIERCICDIIRSKKRMDIEHVKHSVREYTKRKDKDITKLSIYADKLGVKKEVIDFVGMLYE